MHNVRFNDFNSRHVLLDCLFGSSICVIRVGHSFETHDLTVAGNKVVFGKEEMCAKKELLEDLGEYGG